MKNKANKKSFQKVSLILLFICILLTVFCFSACNTDIPENNTYTGVKFTMMPAPPKQKVITSAHDIQTILEFIETTEKDVVTDSDNDKNGWTVKIDFMGEKEQTVSFLGNKMNYNGQIYLIDESIISQLQTLYDSLDYPENALK